MPRLTTRDPRKRFASLYAFIEADLTDGNWRELLHAAARVMTLPSKGDRPLRSRAHIFRWRCSARWPGLVLDVHDLVGAKAIQESFRRKLLAIKAGDTSPAHITLTRLIERRFDRLSRLLTNPPLYVKDRMTGSARATELVAIAYRESETRTCASCERDYIVPSGAKRTSCGDDACRIDVSNARRKLAREAP